MAVTPNTESYVNLPLDCLISVHLTITITDLIMASQVTIIKNLRTYQQHLIKVKSAENLTRAIIMEEIIITKETMMIMINLLPLGTGKSLRTKRIKEGTINSNSKISRMEEAVYYVVKRGMLKQVHVRTIRIDSENYV